MIVLDGTSLTCADVAALGRQTAQASISRDGWERAAAAAEVARTVAASQEVYGRTTGVGANRGLSVSHSDASAHGMRLIRSHAGGGGELVPAELGLAMLAVRANQIAAGGSGVDPGLLGVLADCVNRGLWPPVPVYGGIGTGDLTALAVTALCLLGERDWLPRPDSQARFDLDPADALAFMSSNAATLGEAAIASHDLSGLLLASTVIAALSHLAVSGSAEPYAEPVQLARPHSGQLRVASLLRGLLAGQSHAAARIQDPYGYRALPQVHGPAVDRAKHALRVITVELNSAAENPLIDVAGQAAWHNGNFHTAYVGLALDALRAALFQTAALSAARLGTLMEPGFTGLAPFQATDPAPSSGVMILEYVSHSAVADIRRLATPAALGSAVLSLGVEEHAGFATQSARAATGSVPAYRVVLACELVAAVRALRLRGAGPTAGPLAPAFERAAGALPESTADRPLDADLVIAQELLPELAAVAMRAG
jgi:histidine ammonia-lyase